MKYFLTCLALGFAFAAGAQTGLVEFPYNPDADNDDLIGTADLLELLSLYGSEFSEENLYLSNDSSSALFSAGYLPYFNCIEYCSTLPGEWALPDFIDLGRVWSAVEGTAWLVTPIEAMPFSGYSGHYQPMYLEPDGDISAGLASDARGCYCYTYERPRVEYSYCRSQVGATGETAENQFLDCCNLKVGEGWYPLASTTGVSGNTYFYGSLYGQAFWRWAE